jgi:TonB family protein
MNMMFCILISIMLLYSQPSYLEEKMNYCDSLFTIHDNITKEQIGPFIYDQAPSPIMGMNQLKDYLTIVVNDNTMRGQVFIRVIIDKEGSIICSKILRSNNKKLNELAIKHVDTIYFNPAMYKCKPEISSLVLPVSFTTSKKRDF